MDKIFSARIDEHIVYLIGRLSKKLHVSKKAIIEDAIKKYASSVEQDSSYNVFAVTSGAWKRKESPDATVKKIRKHFEDTMKRKQ